jgi:serine phosphatase RsbU (regulator of sigma subunit)
MQAMEVQVAAAKVGKYATSESGDSLEMVERPGGGFSFVLVDGQLSGKAAKNISNIVARKAISLLGEGVRDGAAARAASDYLYTYRAGKVSATLNILSIDLISRTLVLSRNSDAPAVLVQSDEITLIDGPSKPVGTHRGTRPEITEIPLQHNLTAVVFTDGITHAGDRHGQRLNILDEIRELIQSKERAPAVWADRLLERAVELDDGRPSDDMSVLVASTLPREKDETRRLMARMPI